MTARPEMSIMSCC